MDKKCLSRELKLKDCIAMVVGTIIGTGIFLKTGTMSQLLGDSRVVLLAWAVAGLLSLAGALTYAELGAMFPRAGGEYVYLKESFGLLVGFLFGWTRFWIGSPGSIAAYAVGVSAFMNMLLPEPMSLNVQTSIAVSLVILFTFINCFPVKLGGLVQVILTVLKVAMVLILVVGVFLFSKTGRWSYISENPWHWSGWSTFGISLVAALWAFDGWNNLPMIAGEVREPQKNIPRGLIIGTLIVLLVYGLLNLAYFYALPLSEVMSSFSKNNPTAPSVAAKTALTFLGAAGLGFLAIAMILSGLGAMNGSIMTGSRVPFALATDSIFPKFLARLNHQGVPISSVLVQGVVAALLAYSGTFDQLTDYVIFSSWLFYTLCGIGVFILRKKIPNQDRPYRVWGYPYVPLLFIICSTLILINSVIANFKDSMFGLILIVTGVPLYFWQKKYSKI